MSKATVNLFFDKRASKDGEGVVKWLVCVDRKQRLFSTGQKVNADAWAFLQGNRSKLDNRIKDEDKRALWQRFYGELFTDEGGHQQTGYLKRAQLVVDRLGVGFTFDAFAGAIVNYGKEPERPADQTDLIAALHRKAETMNTAGRVGNGLSYEHAAKSLRRFVDSFDDAERKEFLNIPVPRRVGQQRPAVTLHYKHLTSHFLTVYEQWMLSHGKAPKSPGKPTTGTSMTTIGIYLRHVRAVVNDAMNAGLLNRDAYPFGPGRYVIPAGENVKKALSKTDIETLKAYQPTPGTMEQRGHDLWLFSYFCNGMNLTDICSLTWGQVNMKERKLSFVRQKTARSSKQKTTSITAYLNPQTWAILERWGTTERKPTGYVFPFLTDTNGELLTPIRKKLIVQQVTQLTNKWMRRIADSLGIEADVNTYAARHSFATILLKSNAPLSMISKSLGHTNLKTTESYLGSFDDEEAKAFLTAL
jgi:integrase